MIRLFVWTAVVLGWGISGMVVMEEDRTIRLLESTGIGLYAFSCAVILLRMVRIHIRQRYQREPIPRLMRSLDGLALGITLLCIALSILCTLLPDRLERGITHLILSACAALGVLWIWRMIAVTVTRHAVPESVRSEMPQRSA